MTKNIWADPASFVGTPSKAADVLRLLNLPRIDHYIEALSHKGGINLDELSQLSASTLVAMTGEAHLKTRRVIAPFFSKSGLSSWNHVVEGATNHALDQLAKAAKPDLVTNFTVPLFLQLMPRLLGLSVPANKEYFQAIATVQRLTEPYLSVPTLRKLDKAVGLLIQTCPVSCGSPDKTAPESLLEYLYRRRDDLPEGLDPRYLVVGLLVGSNSATQSLAFALYGLLTGSSALWQDAAQPDWTDRELPRVLSLYQSTKTLVRTAPQDTKAGGCTYLKGQSAVVDIVQANACLRDAGEQGRLHMSFGSGSHKCPGLFLSEMLFAQAIPALARRFPRLVLTKELSKFVDTPMMQAPIALPCEIADSSRRLSSRLCDVRDMSLARQVVRENDSFAPPQMAEHLTTLAEHSDRELSTSIHIARNAMFFMDGERHQELRSAIGKRLGGNRLQDWTALVDTVVTRAVQGLADKPKPDLVRDFSDQLRREVVAPILGIHPKDPDRFEEIAPKLQDVLEPWLPLRALDTVQISFDEALSLMSTPVATTGPKSLLGGLLADQPDGFSNEDLKAVVLVLYGASFNLSHTLANILHLVLMRPPEQRKPADIADWGDASLEELIALCASPKYIYRMARHDLRLGELPMKKGDTARLDIQAINRKNPNGTAHLSFGHGLHRCVGAGLSRLILRRAIAGVFSTYPKISLVAQGQRYFSMSQTVALSALPCTLNE